MLTHAAADVIPLPAFPKSFSAMLIVFAIVLGSIGCSTAGRGKTEAVQPKHAHQVKLELNDGKKWVVAPPMMVQLRNLDQSVQNFGKTSAQNHAALASEIQEHLGRLVTNCTMEGKAHDELHKWLMPFLGLSADYSKSTNLQIQKQKFKEIEQSLQVFKEYFE